MDNLKPSLENLLVFRDKDSNEIVMVESQNGHIERYVTTPCNIGKRNEIFGVDLPSKLVNASQNL